MESTYLKPKQWTQEEALAYADSKWWERLKLDAFRIAYVQLNQWLLAMPWDLFAENVGKALGRPIYAHEFANPDDLIAELLNLRPPPNMQEIMEKLETCMVR